MSKRQTCIYCGAKATRWCDLVIGFSDPDGDGLFSFKDGSEFYRCDSPLCEKHALFKGNIFYCGDGPAAGMETIDHCPDHESFWWDSPKGNHGAWETERMQAITEDEAKRRRYRHRCLAAGPLKAISNPQRALFDSPKGELHDVTYPVVNPPQR